MLATLAKSKHGGGAFILAGRVGAALRYTSPAALFFGERGHKIWLGCASVALAKPLPFAMVGTPAIGTGHQRGSKSSLTPCERRRARAANSIARSGMSTGTGPARGTSGGNTVLGTHGRGTTRAGWLTPSLYVIMSFSPNRLDNLESPLRILSAPFLNWSYPGRPAEIDL
jgi:hypothetical protein